MANRNAGYALLLLSAHLVCGASTAVADIIEFVDGTTVRLAAEMDGETVRLATPNGPLSFPRAAVRSIRVEPWSERDWPAVEARARGGGPSDRYAAALWALDHGLNREAENTLRVLHAEAPEHGPTARLVATLDRLSRPLDDADVAPLTQWLGADFRVARSAHIVLLHQHTESEARERIAYLEDVYTAFHLHFSAHGIDLEHPDQALVSVWFTERDSYVRFLKSEDAGAFLTTRGYYHPTRRVVLTYDTRSEPTRRSALRALERRRQAGGDTRAVGLAFKLAWRELEFPIAAHELVHQLVAATKLAPRHDAFPIWLHEGLAMQFEAVRGGRWAGLGEPSSLRRRDWRSSVGRGHSLASVLRDEGLTQGYRQASYALAWSFVSYLRTEQPEAWASLLDQLRVPDSLHELPTLRARRALLDNGLDDLSEWERRWMSHAARTSRVDLPSAANFDNN